MKNMSKIKLNLIKEKLYFESLANKIYSDIAVFGEDLFDMKYLMENSSDKNNIIKDVVQELRLAPKFIFTFGSGIGAFHGPVTRLLEGSGFNLTEKEVVLLIITSIAILLSESDSKELVKHVKEKGLMDALNSVKEFISNTKELMNTILLKTSGTVYNLSDILGFTFLLVPTMRLIDNAIVENGINSGNLIYLFKGIILASLTYSIKSVLKKISKKL
jgi:hypothetical protein